MSEQLQDETPIVPAEVPSADLQISEQGIISQVPGAESQTTQEASAETDDVVDITDAEQNNVIDITDKTPKTPAQPNEQLYGGHTGARIGDLNERRLKALQAGRTDEANALAKIISDISSGVSA